MGPIENEQQNRNSTKNSFTEDCCNDDTQKIDSQFSQGDGDNDFLGANDDIPSRDPFLLEDAFETQLVNVYEDTQIMDYDGETQVLDDLDCLRSWPSDCNPKVVAGESEGTSITEVYCDTQVVSDHDTANSFDQRQAANVSGVPLASYKKEERHSGSVCKGFTSLRTEAFRAAGLAARARGTNRDLGLSRNDKSRLELGKSAQADFPDWDVSDENLGQNGRTEGVEDPNNVSPIRAKAVRKLFTEDAVAEVVQSEANMNLTDEDDSDNPEFLSSDNCLAGLSYANSEPPGELSQARALEVVDKFLEQNLMEYDKISETIIHTVEKAKMDSGAKGPRDLAKSLRNIVGVSGVYDWDDNREDEGGGDFCLKKKEVFYNGDKKKGSLTEPKKRKRSDLKHIKSVGDHVDKQQETCNKRSVGDSVHSDPGLMLHKRRARSKLVQCEEKVVHKNLAKDLDEHINLAPENKVADIEGSKDIPVVENIGPDTQMAAEAMENLCFEVHLADDNNHSPEKVFGSRTIKTTEKHQSSNEGYSGEQKLAQKKQCATSVGVITRRAKQAISGITGKSNKVSPISIEKSVSARNDHVSEPGGIEQRRMVDSNSDEKLCSSTQPIKKKRRAGLRSSIHDVAPRHGTELAGKNSGKEKESFLQDQLGFSVPVAHRTRKRTDRNKLKVAETIVDTARNTHVLDLRNNRRAAKDKNIKMITIEELKRLRSRHKQPDLKDGGVSSASNLDDLKHMKGKSTQLETLHGQNAGGNVNPGLRRSRTHTTCKSPDSGGNHAESYASGLSSLHKKAKLQKDHENKRSGTDCVLPDSSCLNVKLVREDVSEARETNQVGKKISAKASSSECTETNSRLEASPRERAGTTSSCTTPASCATPLNRPSPVCMGDEYNKQSKARLSLVREMNNLVSSSPGSPSEMKESRRRREITGVRVLFSQHLDVDVVNQQKKILRRLRATVASSMSDATHFVADEFVRTRNMLEAIASAKPVVTHLWLESCGQASCAIDEKSYILRDVKKEKEIGFSMPLSLSKACQNPLLQGQKVLVTPNTKPGKDILASLVTAIHGVAVERFGRSVLNAEKLPDDILILSCEEDYDICVPFLEKGGAIYSSELLLNGIVKQKLEYERHRLFEDHVKRTRSTIRVKKNRHVPMSRCRI